MEQRLNKHGTKNNLHMHVCKYDDGVWEFEVFATQPHKTILHGNKPTEEEATRAAEDAAGEGGEAVWSPIG